MIFFATIILFRILVWVLVYMVFRLLKKDPNETLDFNSSVSLIVTGAFGFLASVILASKDECYLIKYDSISSFLYISEMLLKGSLIGSFGMLMGYAWIISPYVIVKDKVSRLHNLKDNDNLNLFIPISLHVTANTAAFLVFLGYFMCN